jgi:two-component system osmolarity sensor histidine kinase EnvZ
MDDSRAGPGGAGLGLAIVERIARAHGGTLELLPRPGGGLIARITLNVS